MGPETRDYRDFPATCKIFFDMIFISLIFIPLGRVHGLV